MVDKEKIIAPKTYRELLAEISRGSNFKLSKIANTCGVTVSKVDAVPDIACATTSATYSCGNSPVSNYGDAYRRGYDKGIDDYDDAVTIDHIIYNPPATIVFWKNGEKTVVKCSKAEKFNKYHGFCAALAKRIYGNNSQVNKLVNSGFEEKPINKKDKKGSKKK